MGMSKSGWHYAPAGARLRLVPAIFATLSQMLSRRSRRDTWHETESRASRASRESAPHCPTTNFPTFIHDSDSSR